MAQHVLIVDDEPNIVLSLEFLLSRSGFSVATANDGEGALAAAREQRPDVVLLDIMLPGMDGYELCQALREQPGLESVPILMLTARGREVDREKGLSLGADDYIVKPFSTREVVERVRRLAGEAD
ncbi:response regulator transcription factor [Sediminicurvatus halobius]|uniref:Two-component system response regulator n=1 Tax=Sediminicurvatus halobius TaxID=2182432 RepID=A0A2U2N3D9_9GAMM|nr:response regulator [Spiribacter halobius]PWG63558.1 two-component system response regulator [Spiribacter halobius]UEX79563.1 response regulator [Spiribacter halobius]